MKDLYGRDIDYLRVSLTPQCNLRCLYCVPDNVSFSESPPNLLSLDELYEIIYRFSQLGIKKIRLTGGEPLIRKGSLSLIEKIAQIKGIEDIALTTNGHLLKDYAKDLKSAGLHRLNISLDSLVPSKYKEITGGGCLEQVLEGIDKAREVGLTPLKINTVLIKDFNDQEITQFVQWTKETAIDVRFIELMPIGQGIQWAKEKYLSADRVLETVPALELLPNQDPSSTAIYYQLPNAKGRIGLIKPVSCKFCHQCNRIRLTADGKIQYCLLANERFDIKKAMDQGDDLYEHLKNCILRKPQVHHLEDHQHMTTNMFRIGG